MSPKASFISRSDNAVYLGSFGINRWSSDMNVNLLTLGFMVKVDQCRILWEIILQEQEMGSRQLAKVIEKADFCFLE